MNQLQLPAIHSLGGALWGLLILCLYAIAARVALYLFRRLFLRPLGKMHEGLPRRVLVSLETPVFLAVLLFGLYVLLGRVLSLGPYEAYITLGAKIALILILFFGLNRLLRALIAWYTTAVAPKTHAPWDERAEPLVRRLVSIAVYMLAGLAVLQQLDVRITPLLASLGVASLAVALALQDTLANFFAGLWMIADRPITVGDFIRIESGQEGRVDRIGWRTTRVMSTSNDIIMVPNSKLAQSIVVNYDLPSPEHTVVVPFSVGQDSDLARVEEATLAAARAVIEESAVAVKTFPPVLRYTAFGDSNIQLVVVMRAVSAEQSGDLVHEFIRRLHACYKEEGSEFKVPSSKSAHIEIPPSSNLEP